MLCKVAAMGGKLAYVQISQSTIVWNAKQLGRKVNNFSQSPWEKIVCSVAYAVLYQKFSKSDSMRRAFFDTRESLPAEAAPNDNYWEQC